MSHPFACQLLVDPPLAGAENMARDEALLDLAATKGAATQGIASVRVYQWQEPTLSLGYFQNYADRQQHPASLGAAVVRRQSGGGAILHDRELTYSLALPSGHPCARNAQLLYDTVHQALAELLTRQLPAGHQLQLFPEQLARETEPFLCFQRRARGDIVHFSAENRPQNPCGAKVVGSAQRRSRGAVLQHGSVLIARSACCPELAGLNELGGLSLTADQLAAELGEVLLDCIAPPGWHREMRDDIRVSSESWYNNKYGDATWTTRR